MSDSGGNASGGGSGVCGFLFILFVALKLTHQIAWSWRWVTAPLWGGVALFIGWFAVSMLVIGVIAVFSEARRNQR